MHPSHTFRLIAACALSVSIGILGVLAAPGAAAAEPIFTVTAPSLGDATSTAWRATVSIETVGRRPGARAPIRASGSGVVVARRADGRALVVTAAHVVAPGSSASVVWTDGSRSALKAIWRRGGADLALLEAVDAPASLRVPAVVWGAAGAPPTGEVVAMGYPSTAELGAEDLDVEPSRVLRRARGRIIDHRQGLRARVRALASRATVGRLRLGGVFEHSAPVVPGSSGGPLVSRSDGAVLGVHVGSLQTKAGECRRGSGGECLHLAADLAAIAGPVERWLQARE
ncbi:MAG: serine protease [Acidobacteriota bacterium]